MFASPALEFQSSPIFSRLLPAPSDYAVQCFHAANVCRELAAPPALDTGQTRINYYHRPELLLRPPDEPDGNPERGP